MQKQYLDIWLLNMGSGLGGVKKIFGWYGVLGMNSESSERQDNGGTGSQQVGYRYHSSLTPALKWILPWN